MSGDAVVWFSSRGSIERQEISVLALIETFVAIVLSAYLFYRLNWKYASILIVLSPLSLLRSIETDSKIFYRADYINRRLRILIFRSFLRRLYGSLYRRADADQSATEPAWKMILEFCLFIIFFPIFFILVTPMLFFLSYGTTLLFTAILTFIKMMIVFEEFAKTPIKTLGNIPENWRRIVLCTDSMVAPEFVPGIHAHGAESKSLWRYTKPVLQEWTKGRHYRGALIMLFFIYLVGASYRWSVKCSALVWSPLVWVFRPLKGSANPLYVAEGVVHLGVNKIARTYSAVVLIIMASKIYLFVFYTQLERYLAKIPGWGVFSSYISPDSVALWHIAAALSAIISWWMYAKASQYLYDAKYGDLDSQKIKSFFEFTFYTRNVLGAYTSVCICYITLALTNRLTLPHVRFIIFPW